MNSSPVALGEPGGRRARSRRDQGPTEAVPDITGVPSALCASMRRWTVDGRRRLHLLALDHHRAEVAADAAALEPGPAPHQRAEGIELAEVGRRLDRRAGEPEPPAVSASWTLA